MPLTPFENANHIAGQSKLFPMRQFAEYFSSINIIGIPPLIAKKFDLKEGDCLIWHYYDDQKAAIVAKREGWKSRKPRISQGEVKK
jgi:hypothetical protein